MPLSALGRLLYPPRCLACDAPVAPGAPGLCAPCWRETVFVDSALACARCAAPAEGGSCEACTHRPPPWERCRAALYYDGPPKALVMGLKHGDRTWSAPVLAAWMARAAGPLLSQADMIVPVPLHWTRLFRRRFNQSAELGRALSRASGVPFAPQALRRPKRTASQGLKSAAERRDNLRDAFRVPAPARVAGRRVLLIDDVLTTGATAGEAARTLMSAGAAAVDLLVLSRVARLGDAAI